ncbi:unnamed protein product [Effrenium voratum]|uniref:ASCH domain-containing protein n=1 Tax=Effrenium voratum TaxID=2562239 RepID=A0AA36HZK7_9DINO|nr:unnamed protein product [Effrenium voratum]
MSSPPAMQAKPPVNSARVPYLDFAEDFVGVISRGEKRATTRCPGPKDTDVTSDLDAVIAQGWALATAGGRSSFALLAVDRVERRALAEVDDSLAQEEGLHTGDELRSTLQRFYPELAADDVVTVVHFQLLKLIPAAGG